MYSRQEENSRLRVMSYPCTCGNTCTHMCMDNNYQLFVGWINTSHYITTHNTHHKYVSTLVRFEDDNQISLPDSVSKALHHTDSF